ncbi:hypothetical protein G7046_g918 [Stylonectria norvegica]|nr:hypothetical protein G7046_g918 [Stylonectria norvegica]
MAGAAPPIPSLKTSFIATQTTLLSQPLAPSRAWLAANDASDEAIPERVYQDALFHLNHSIQQHCRRVYAPQATRNIAEQINSVYIKDAERRVGGEGDAEGGIGRELDLTDPEAIEALPAAWTSDKDAATYPMEAKRYADTVRQLSELSEQRQKLREQVAKLARLKAIVAPLQVNDDGAGVQENIVVRDGAIETELEKMRFLLARVGGRIQALPELEGSDTLPKELAVAENGSLGTARKRRVDQFLADQAVFPS